MAKLNVQAAARWAGGAPDQVLAGQLTYQRLPMVLALSVTNEDGAGIDHLEASEIRVGYQMQPDVT
jgi:hypothetical protein